jgi:hypothetical protein
MSRFRRLLIVILVVACGLPLLGAAPASAELTLQVSDGHLVDRGATALVGVTVTCETGTTFDLVVDANLTQQQGLTPVFGHTVSSQEDVVCADGEVTTMLTVHAWGGTFQEDILGSLQVYARTSSHDTADAWVDGDSFAAQIESRLVP